MEQWKKIQEATNYEVSNLGRIRNTKSGQILNPGIAGNGYKQVSIKFKDSGKFKKQYVHRLVAQNWLFNDDPINKKEVNHKDLNRSNNEVSNLEWVTSSDNQKHKYQNGNYKTSHRKVVQMDLEGNDIQVFESIIDAARSLNIDRQGIDRAVHKRAVTQISHGYKWRFLD